MTAVRALQGEGTQGWRTGDVAAFRTVAESHQKRILNIVFRITGDYHQACEVTRDSLVAAWRAGEPPAGCGLLPWLTGIALLQAREQRQARTATRAGRAADASSGSAAGDEWLQSCLEMLPYDLREVLVLRDLERFTYDDICQILQVRQDLLRARLFRSREMLKNCLRDTEGAHEGA